MVGDPCGEATMGQIIDPARWEAPQPYQEPPEVKLRRARLALQAQIVELIDDFEGEHEVTVKEVVLTSGLRLHPDDVNITYPYPVRYVERTHAVQLEVAPWGG